MYSIVWDASEIFDKARDSNDYSRWIVSLTAWDWHKYMAFTYWLNQPW